MKALLFIAICLLSGMGLRAQASFSNVEFKLNLFKDKVGTSLSCTQASFSFKFSLRSKTVEIIDQAGFASVDSQVIQIIPLKVSGLEKRSDSLNSKEQEQLLAGYSKYELDYFIKELKIEVINPSSQWVTTNSGKWLVWYFRVGDHPAVSTGIKTEVQLFASTIVNGQILTLNAPILKGGDFQKAALIVNEMMESLKIVLAE